MSVAQNIDVIRKEIEAFNGRDWDAYLDCFANSIVTYEPDEDNPIRGHKGLKERIVTYTRAFPDVRLETERLFGQGDLVCLNSLFIGTHKGNLPGPGGATISPTGKPVRVHGCSVFRFRDGKITEFIGYYDQVELFAQIGKKVHLA
jgi:steroid delta-isomerase-like uncharacterized protein